MSKVLSINAGSSSLKFQLFNMPSEEVLCSGLIERIGLSDGICTFKFNNLKETEVLDINNHQVAVELVLNGLIKYNIVKNLNEIKGVGHRIVHGGELYAKSVVIDDEVEKNIEKLSDLAPLHNPANLIGYQAFKKALPDVVHTAVFDTAFHQTMSEDVYLYPLPYEYYEQYGIRKYGFHGTSHLYVSNRAKELINIDKPLNIITCHLGNGASLSAIKNQQSVNTSMGFTPLAGVMMGTRCGDVDPSIITYLMAKLNCSAQEVVDIYNKKSGMLGVSGISSDARDIGDGVARNDKRCILTTEMYANRVVWTIGSYFVQLGHVDCIVFTGGLGENDTNMRAEILKRLEESMSLEIDYELNSQTRGKEVTISKENSKTRVMVIPTNEEVMIARDTYAFMG